MILDSLITLAATNPVDHVVNMKYAEVGGYWVWSAHVGNLLLAGLLTYLLLSFAAKRISTGPERLGNERYLTGNKLAATIEVIMVYLRESAVRPLLGSRTDRFMPLLWTLFFFILINNLLGLMPIADLLHLIDMKVLGQEHGHEGFHLSGLFGATATGNIFVTAALAIMAGLIINVEGLRELGPKGYVKHLTAETPWYLWPIMVPIEVLGTFIKPVALALRLFANMTAGHILIAVLFMFAINGLDLALGRGTSTDKANPIIGAPITLISFVAAIAITFLELFVAFLQAFVFMFLTTVFISLLAHHHDHEHEGAHHGHEHAHA